MASRYGGRLKKWNADRGFGFITADDGGAELFVHVSAFLRNGQIPTVGEELTFEVEPDKDGKKRAARVRRPGEMVTPAPWRNARPTRNDDGSPGFVGKIFSLVLVCAIGWYGYTHYAKRAAPFDSALPAPPVAMFSAKLPVPPDFKCDGRNMCSQMTSCKEATLFLQNCPGMQMDGNGDGVPCEQQWCR